MDSSEKVKRLKETRERTFLGMGECRKALEESNWDVEDAIVLLQKMGVLKSAEKGKREAKCGLVYSYIHHDGSVGTMVEVNCETEFVAKNSMFKDFCEKVALQIVAESPEYLSVNEIGEEAIAKQQDIFTAQIPEKVPAERRAGVLTGKMKKWYERVCLVDQKSVTENSKTIEQMRANLVHQLGENIVIKRFVRWEVGG